MDKLEEILADTAATLFAMGQDHVAGDGSASKVDEVVDKAKEQVKDLFDKLLESSQVLKDRHYDEVRQKVESL